MPDVTDQPKLCALCRLRPPIENSHIIPSFVTKYLKHSSATGFLRHAQNTKIRKQDGFKTDLLCSNCETLFSGFETKFANHVFHPYVNEVLDESGHAVTYAEIPFSDWLLNFIISVQWRALHYQLRSPGLEVDNTTHQAILDTLNNWRQFLLKGAAESCKGTHHLIFLQSFNPALEDLPEDLPDKINFILHRTVDFTFITSPSGSQAMYCRLGPVVLLSDLTGENSANMEHTVVAKGHILSTRQKLLNSKLNQFIFIDRPILVAPILELSDTQKKNVEQTMMRDIQRTLSSKSIKTLLTDRLRKK